MKKLMKNSFRYQKRQKTFKVKRNYNFEREESIIRIYKSRRILVGQAIKSAGRMPWHWEPKKDVVSCEKLWGAASRR